MEEDTQFQLVTEKINDAQCGVIITDFVVLDQFKKDKVFIVPSNEVAKSIVVELQDINH